MEANTQRLQAQLSKFFSFERSHGARDRIGQGGAYVNHFARWETEAKISLEQALSGKAVLLRAGKKNYHLLIVEDQ